MVLGQIWIMDSNGNHGSNLPLTGNENAIFDIAKSNGSVRLIG